MSCSQLAAVIASLTGVPGKPLISPGMPGVCARPKMLMGALPLGEGVWRGPLLLLFLVTGDRYTIRGAELGVLH